VLLAFNHTSSFLSLHTWLNPVKVCDAVLSPWRTKPVAGRVFPADPSEPKTVEKLVPYGAEPRQNLDLEKESGVSVGTNADSVKMEPVDASRVGDALATEDRLVPGKLKKP